MLAPRTRTAARNPPAAKPLLVARNTDLPGDRRPGGGFLGQSEDRRVETVSCTPRNVLSFRTARKIFPRVPIRAPSVARDNCASTVVVQDNPSGQRNKCGSVR